MRRTPEEAAQTRAAVLAAALEVFAEKGYGATTIGDVAARARLTRGAVYHHFTDKADLCLATIAEHWAVAATPIWGRLDDESLAPRDRIRQFLVAFFTEFGTNSTFRTAFSLSMQGGEFPELSRGLADKQQIMGHWANQLTNLLTLAGEATQRQTVPPRAGAITIISAVNGAAATFLACPELFSPTEQAETLAQAILDGVLPAEAE